MLARTYSASALLVTLMLLLSVTLFFLFHRENLLKNDRAIYQDYQHYLADKLQLNTLIRLDKEKHCQQQKKETVSFAMRYFDYSFHCVFHSLFKRKPTKEKYIQVEQIDDWLNIAEYQSAVIYIDTLSALPHSSETNPQIVMATQAIRGRLTQDFYGIVITDYPFVFTDKKIYGTIYSTYKENDSHRRNHSFKRSVIQGLEDKFSSWAFLPNSENILQNE